jgi:hypothetical protein
MSLGEGAARGQISLYGREAMDIDQLADIPAKDPGEDFEALCWGLLRRRYPPEQLIYIPSQMGGDYGIEGFSTDGISYQCYADRDSLTLRHRTDKQKDKLYDDTQKLEKYKDKLEAVLHGVVLDYYFLMVPQYHAAELVSYAAKRAEVVRGFGLPFIGSNFAIRIKEPNDYPAEMQAALTDASAKCALPVPAIADEHVRLFETETPHLAAVMDEKLAVVKQHLPSADVEQLRDFLIRAFLAKEQVMDALRSWPDTWEAVERRRQLRQDALELESELSDEQPNRRILKLINDYSIELTENVGGVREADAQRLARGQTGEWLMRCPLRFKAVTS